MKYLFLFVSSFLFAQQTQYVDFKSVSAKISLDQKDKSISGILHYNFDVLKPTDTIEIDAKNMIFSDLKLNDKIINYVNSGTKLVLIFPFSKGSNQLTFTYSARPKQALYFVADEIWTQGQGKYTSNWFPSFDDVNEKVIFNLEIAFDAKYQVISNGILKHKTINKDVVFWKYEMQKPMSSYLLMLAIGKWSKQTQISISGIPLEMYFQSKDISKFEPTYRYSKQIFDFLEKEIGLKYPWKIYKQVPIRDFLYAGMENTTATLFSNRYVVDAIGFQDRDYVNVNAHELAHQWFGDLVTAVNGKHHWLQEGFATYYGLLAERKIYGNDYFYSKLYQSAQQLKYASKSDTIPILNPKASSLSFYEKGAWALWVLHEKIGDKFFKIAVKNYLSKHSFESVNTNDFLDEIKKISPYDVTKFSKTWLESALIDTTEINELLKKNKSSSIALAIDKLRNKPLSEKKNFFIKTLQSKVYFTVKVAIVNQLKSENYKEKKELLLLALKTNNLKIRQAVALNFNIIPSDFRQQYELFLDDKSYQTKEIVLYNLWNSFPKFRFQYLDKSKKWIGFNDYNLRTLWLSLALSTEGYLSDKNPFITEIVGYTSELFEATTRQNALENAINFHLINDIVLLNLAKAITHPVWQFSKFARENCRNLMKDKNLRASFISILPKLNESEQTQLNRLLAE